VSIPRYKNMSLHLTHMNTLNGIYTLCYVFSHLSTFQRCYSKSLSLAIGKSLNAIFFFAYFLKYSNLAVCHRSLLEFVLLSSSMRLTRSIHHCQSITPFLSTGVVLPPF
jgi:hypothetical protein